MTSGGWKDRKAAKDNMARGLNVFKLILNHESASSLKKVLHAYLVHMKERLAPLLKLATWVEVWRHPLTRRARSYAAQVMKAVRAAMKELFRNVALLLSCASAYAKQQAAKKAAERQKKSYGDLASTLIAGLLNRSQQQPRDNGAGSRAQKIDVRAAPKSADFPASPALPSPPNVSYVSPEPLAGAPARELSAPNTFESAEKLTSSPKDDIKLLCNTSMNLIDLDSESQGESDTVRPPARPSVTHPPDTPQLLTHAFRFLALALSFSRRFPRAGSTHVGKLQP